MGLYLNSNGVAALYQSEMNKPYFVDKTLLLEKLIPLVEQGRQYICITRPRRFGKTIMANMIGAFFGKNDKGSMFDGLKISKQKGYVNYRNGYNVIFIDFSKVDDECENYTEYITPIKEILREDLHKAYPNIDYRENGTVAEDLLRIYEQTGATFIFVMDEWDYIFHQDFVSDRDKKSYIKFLNALLKDRAYVQFAYMTGILPIAKYSSGSELNMFLEYTMVSKNHYSDYFGFTDSEVDMLYGRYQKLVQEPQVTREGLREWYDGYYTKEGGRLYNPRSIVASLQDNQFADYWTSSGPYDEIFYYVKNNIADVRDDIAKMIAREAVYAEISEYSATSTEIKTRDEIMSAMVVYGFLTYYDGKVSIPNRELMDKFADMVKKENALGYVYRLAKESERMLEATKTGDTDTMAAILQQAHDTETGMASYNSEAELSAIVRLVYLSARERYDIQREDKAGVGFVDYIFYPKVDLKEDCIIIELKVDSTAENAIQQIKDRNYAERFTGKLGEQQRYTGRILAVGISYYKKDTTKRHECKVEVLREPTTTLI